MNLPDWSDSDLTAAAPALDSAAASWGVSRALVYAVASQESRFKANAYRAEPRINDASYGLMQILFGTARGLGYPGTSDGLYDPAINADLGAQLLAQLLEANNETDALSRYNSGYPAASSSAGRAYAASVVVRRQYFDQVFGASPPGPLT